MTRLTYSELMRQVRDARQYTTIGGNLAVMVSGCPTCGATPGMLCTAIFGSGDETNSIHAERAHAAANHLGRPRTARVRT